MRKAKILAKTRQSRRSGPTGSGRDGQMSAFAQRVLQQVRRCGFVSAGQRIGVAVSGGADSVALLLLLLELREPLGIVLSVVHFNHKLRGKASDSDEKFVAKLAAGHGLAFFVEQENVAARAKRERGNLEEVARRRRYAFFAGLVAQGKADRIAVAHTADDQAETVLAHILRGTGLAGLGGIHPKVEGVFRPLLKIRRAELRVYLRARRQTWREDATNRDTKRTRARIRRKLIPLLEKQFQPAVVEHLCQLADLAREEDAWLESSAELRVFLNAKEEKGAWRIGLGHLVGAPREDGRWAGLKTGHYTSEAGPGEQTSAEATSMKGEEQEDGRRADLKTGCYTGEEREWSRRAAEAMSKRMIRLLVKKVKPHGGQLGAVHVDAVLHLAQQPDSGKSLHLPGGVEVRRGRDSLCFRALERMVATETESKPYAYPLDLGPGETELRVVEHSCALRFRVIDWPPQGRETKETGAVLDRDKLRVPLVVRNWRPGDAVQPVGHQKRHRLSRLLNEVGISRWEKESWPVLTSGGKIAWTRGLAVSAEFAVGGTTRAGVVITEVGLA